MPCCCTAAHKSCAIVALPSQKSNMQGLLGRTYTSSLHCARTIYGNEGLRGMYKGAPRA
jgi:hypothetical protein